MKNNNFDKESDVSVCQNDFKYMMHMLRGSSFSKNIKNNSGTKCFDNISQVSELIFKLFFNWIQWQMNNTKLTDQLYFMYGDIRMIRLGIGSHDPPEPEGSTQGQSTS